tara:strand:- start:12333 stop:12611 length:279 start_codon:yes stop_codon:yes gene_type:complete
MENLTIDKNVPMPPVFKTGNRIKQDYIRDTILMMAIGDSVGFVDRTEAQRFRSRAYSMCKRGDVQGKFILRAIYPSNLEDKEPVFYRVWRIS